MADGASAGAASASEVTFRVRYAETDQMGRAYYGAYFAWFEVGRVELLRELGATYAELERQGYLLPVAEASARYLAPASYDEMVVVRTSIVRAGKSRIEFVSEVASKDSGRTLAEGRVVLACVGPEGRPKRLPAALAERIERIERIGGAGPGRPKLAGPDGR